MTQVTTDPSIPEAAKTSERPAAVVTRDRSHRPRQLGRGTLETDKTWRRDHGIPDRLRLHGVWRVPLEMPQ
jgi:hypothetical protein